MVSRKLHGVQLQLVISDAHEVFKAAIAAALSAAAWQRYRTHFARNLLAWVPKSAQDIVAAMLPSNFALPNAGQFRAQRAQVGEQLGNRF